ncbi:hypothetical protein PFDSM3638_00540 [Pyrococcus furiosus DSM 3638]|uniref:UPF0146 protein PF0123 n=3 Tax=Pyrococcus furiosus TaxID=2261 RepID=Y123_PYRFU|nr:UPF0146 family protein [Pyrococcus furiosus]Q8U4G5.1 RecName: Full=UPF0146 protein PF0123 [Pyrococcus furiosus DSM 3638]AAL80247.1 putative methyltransferase [Pyrococcus furiosus DSM 3638]AFN04453.1 hypothetical protein PFC_07585 [Pyrococcus furiosus COM1]QEK77853.1 hypothetical protein PFDSM3638_00540 [Pyrococcus furiosus DSM 3638]
MEALAELIKRKVPNEGLIIEVGVGFYLKVAKKLKEYGFNVVVVDINQEAVKNAIKERIPGFVDDVFNPNLKIYLKARAIYSIRPNPEIMMALLTLAKKVKVPLYIVPLSGDVPPREMKLINYKGISVYVWEP